VFARLTASQIRHSIGCAATLSCAAVALSAAPALANATAPAGCEAEKFSQPFAAFKDFNYYKLVPGGEFNGPSENWVLTGGARVTQATRPNGTAGGVLDLPAGSEAISPLINVTLQDRTARVWVRDLQGAGGVKVSVSYVGTSSFVHPKDSGHVHGQQSAWTLATPFNVQPQTAGSEEGVRKMRFVFDAEAKNSDTQLFALWVDPRMIGNSQYGGSGCGGNSGARVRGATGESPQGIG
jgi:hypothetical protein